MLYSLSGAGYKSSEDAFDVCEMIAILGEKLGDREGRAYTHVRELMRVAGLETADPERYGRLMLQLKRAAEKQ